MVKKCYVILLFLLSFGIGYIRETIFLVINSVLYNYPFPYNASYVKPPQYLYDLSIDNLIIIKWILTFLFSLLFMGIAVLITNTYYKVKRYNLLVIYIYFILLVIAFFIAISGLVLNQYQNFFQLSRLIAGVLQSPLLPIFIFISFYINKVVKEK